ncbi:alpha/beta hydrolase [uncultured Methylobacterium sp.]|uniref:alpha/beta hydrolase n=1 Tax=uncultured Methylobacterium sp. TaxID=157278 RepID=UPI0035CA7D45
MASLRAYLASYMVRRNVRNRLGTMGDVAQIRAVFGGRSFPDPAGAAYEPGTVGGVPGEWVRPRRAAGPECRLLYLHGGGFVACSPTTHRPVTGALAERGFTVFAPDYRLAPEHPFPAAVEDACAAWSAFAAEGPGCIAGDSAGGNLALVAMLAARDRGVSMPMAAALFSPVTDFLAADGSRVTNAGRDAMFDPRALVKLGPMYLSGADAADPRVSPLNADLAGLPPLLFHVGEREILRDDAVRMAEKARAAGVTVSLEVFPVVTHVWQFAHSMLPEARRSLDGAAVFLKAHCLKAHA